MTCCVCKQNREDGHTVRLTDEEKAVYRKLGTTPPDELFYCTPCQEIIKRNGVQVLAGFYRKALLEQDDPDADKKSEAFRKKLLSKKG